MSRRKDGIVSMKKATARLGEVETNTKGGVLPGAIN